MNKKYTIEGKYYSGDLYGGVLYDLHSLATILLDIQKTNYDYIVRKEPLEAHEVIVADSIIIITTE